MHKFVSVFLLAAVTASAQSAQSASYRHDGKFALPNATLTPGTVDARLVADVSGRAHRTNGVEANLCAKDFRTGPWRKVSESEKKKKACAAYGILKGCPGPNFELDHLVSLEIGGSDAISNLWPQPIKEARIKDHQTEDVLPKLVCSGKMTLKEAQSCISSDWVVCGKKIQKLKGK